MFFTILTPAGRYVLMVSLYDRLGGHVLKWSNLKGQQWGGATLPLQHDGEFFNIEVKVGARMFLRKNGSVSILCHFRFLPNIRTGWLDWSF